MSDKGIRGLTVKLKGELQDVHIVKTEEGAEVDVGAGAKNASLVAMVLGAGCVGIEFLGTIPGTFGGALIMNAGAHGGEIKSFVRYVDVLDAGLSFQQKDAAECGFQYRSSAFAASDCLLSARLKLQCGDAKAAKESLAKMRAHRKTTQPTAIPNAGSIFKNPEGDYAGRLIEACDLKGMRLGGAEVSPLHANFIVNVDGATANDVVRLADQVCDVVLKQHGVALQWEVKRIGEW